MKRTVILTLLVSISILTGCSSTIPGGIDESPADTTIPTHDTSNQPSSPNTVIDSSPSPEQSSEYQFVTKGLVVMMGADAAPIIDALGEPQNYFEAPSCAFEGIDRIYYFSGFELYTFPVDGEDFVLSLSLTDDSVTTNEGVYLGMTYDRMVAAYGDDYEQYLGQYTYKRGSSSLSFLIEDSKIVLITYTYTDAPRLQ